MGGTHHVRLFVLVTIALAWFDTVQGGSPPKWDIQSASLLTRGIREDTPIGTSLLTLRCIDEDGDSIRYKRYKGNAVNVNPLSGVVTLTVELDFEKVDTIGYDLEFGCHDVDSLGFQNHNDVLYEVEMTVNDANDVAPEFNVDNVEGYYFEVLEGDTIGFDLTPFIEIVDRDRQDNARLSSLYIICNSPNPNDLIGLPESSVATCTKFSLSYKQTAQGKYEAKLHVDSPLDFETKRVYTSKLVAIDGPTDGQAKLSTTINIQINVIDAQDVDPIFLNLGASTNVVEGAQTGSPVNLAISARDGDFGDKRPVKIVMLEDEKDAFTLGPAVESTSEKGVYVSKLTVQNALDRETLQSAYEFVVKVIELNKDTGAETSATATATYSVQVSDIDDEPPRFAEPVYKVNVTEMEFTKEAVQITGLRMVCSDADTSPNGKYSVRIVSQPVPNVYSISPGVEFTGTAILFLTVNDVKYLDYDVEAYRSQTIVLRSESLGLPRLSGSTTVSITLQDINDNRPKFEKSSYEFEVSENIGISQLPYSISTIKATDEDSGSNGKVTYRLEGGTSSKFEIDADSGQLTLVGLVDYENSPLFVFLVFAVDQGHDQRTSQVQVTVNIKNENDQLPVFSQNSYETSINELDFDFLTPIIVSATDNEDGTGVITYDIVEGQTAFDTFVLDRFSGELSLDRNLDYVKDGYHLVISASDNGSPPQTSTVPVLIRVIDENNYAPVLNPKTYYKTLSELVASGTFVEKVTGTDQDDGEFGKLTYRIISGGLDNFDIDPVDGTVTVRDSQTFDFDVKQTYTIKIKASDTGAPQLTDEAILTVTITDANNKKPEFTANIYIGTVDEKEDINFVILTVEATDLDSNKDLAYTFKEISARDGSGKKLTDTFPYDYKNALGLREDTGEIYIKSKLDKVEALEFTIIVQVEDKNALTDGQVETTRVAITVQGDPRTDVTFNRVEPSTLNEGSNVGYEITTVTAKDPVTGTTITNYELTEPSPFFEVIRGTGEVKLKSKIDYEEDPHENIIVIRAIANDGVRSAQTPVVIRVNDDNDNAPQFKESVYYATVDEDAPSLQSVISLSAKDADTSSFGPVEYQIFGGLDSDHFSLFRTGKGVDVILAKGVQLDFNNRDSYDIDIIAMDNVNKQFSTVQQISMVKLIITVRDKNNHKPEFLDEGKVRKMAVAETADLGRSIGTISATDNDFGLNGDVLYTLKSINDPSSTKGIELFSIVTRSGIVRVANSLVGYGERVFKMQVFAQDSGTPFLSNSLDLEIEVLRTENNDGNPVWYFPPNNFILLAPEEESNFVITDGSKPVVFSTAPRTGSGVVYSISPLSEGYDSFTIDPATGSITVVKSLDREQKASYKLLVYAGDTSNVTEIRTGRQIVISLQDKDDNDPTFTNPKNYLQCGQAIPRPMEISFYEAIDADIVIDTLRACDPDAQKEMYYYLYDGSDYCREGNRKSSSSLSLSMDGKLRTTRIIHYEEDPTFIICAYVTDTVGGSPGGKRKKRSFDLTQVDTNLPYVAYLLIHVRDINDNKPKFPKRTVSAVMLTDARDYPVVVLDAKDDDGPGFNIPVYTIVDVKFYASDTSTPIYPGRSFVIENNELHPDPPRGQTFQEFAGGRFALTIRAEDPVNPNYYDTQVVTIYVHKKGQAMKVILNIDPSAGYAKGEDIVKSLNDVSSRYTFRYLHVSAHNDKDGMNIAKTDVCFLAVDSDTHAILNINDLLDLLGNSGYQEILRNADNEILNSGKCYPSTSSEEHVKWKDLWWVLVVVAIFIGVCAIFFMIIIVFMHRRYRRYMKTHKTFFVPQ